ncbi:MAG: hypothetical protein ACFB50_10625, partial [Rubrobacteraceae bacterium]
MTLREAQAGKARLEVLLELPSIGDEVARKTGARCSIIWGVLYASRRRSMLVPALPPYLIEPIW